MAALEDRVREALGQIQFPGFSRNILACGVVRKMRIDGTRVHVDLALDRVTPQVAGRIEESVRRAVLAVEGVTALDLSAGQSPGAGPSSLNVLDNPPPAAQRRATPPDELLPGVRDVVAVASGKGGVGKSTVAVNLAVALARRGTRTALLDADIYGPSIPLMMGAQTRQPTIDTQAQRVLPLESFGVQFMSLGFLVDPEAAVIWRGPMVMKALEQLLRDVQWGEQDVLVVDLPPGTGDAQLTLSQRVRLSGAVIVTTPQDVALADAIKSVNMFRKVGVPVMGLVENMSYFVCPHCSGQTDVFGHGGGRAQAERLGIPFLGEVPLEPAIRASGDEGKPVAAGHGVDAAITAFLQLAEAVADRLRQHQEI